MLDPVPSKISTRRLISRGNDRVLSFFFFEDRLNVRTKRLILSIGNNMGNISTHLGTKHSRDFLVRTVAALCNSTLTRVVGITIREKFTAFTRGRDKILRDPRV